MRNRTTQIRARKLRNQSTDAERLLWQHLRHKQIYGFRFRRQFPIDAYIVDFACIEAKLVVELDGGQHQEQPAYDTRRDAQIHNQGYRVLRFWNNQVFAETTAVLEVILKALLTLRPHPDLPPQAEEGTS
ncbi:MAG: endonuclease domain-containing protein [Burkholderiales bacterium]